MHRGILVMLTASILLCARSGASGAVSPDLTKEARITASSMAAPSADGKYGTERLRDDNTSTHWASSNASLPQWLQFDWAEPVTFDTIITDIFATQAPNLYASWDSVRLSMSDGTTIETHLPKEETVWINHLEKPHTVSWLKLEILSVHEPKHYVGISTLGVYLDPHKRIAPPKKVAGAKSEDLLQPRGRTNHPIVYMNSSDVTRARRNVEQTEWGRQTKQSIVKDAETWLQHEEAYWLKFLPEPGACYAYGFTGCPICGSSCGTWGGARCSWDTPGKVTCGKGHTFPDEAHPDEGNGYAGEDGRHHYIIGIWNAWVTEQWTRNALPALSHAYALTGNERFAECAAFFLDAMASIYAESTSGSWDYPSSPPSGRFARPWYQVARNLVVYVEAYDLIYNSPSLDKPSLRPSLENNWNSGPTRQYSSVRTEDVHGRSWQGMTRRENIDFNLMQNGAEYCYRKTFSGKLHNGHADYLRGALAVGALLGIPEYVYNAIESPYSIYGMLANNCDRDGRYYETALGYALHARNLYLTFVEPLRYWRCDKYPDGIDLFADPRMRSFFFLPDLAMNCAGHSPNFGDAGPDNRYQSAPERPFSQVDYGYAERLYAGSKGKAHDEFAAILHMLSNGDIEKARRNSRTKRWLLYHADPLPENGQVPDLPDDLKHRVFGSWLLGQKGIGILRNGKEEHAQAVLLRYGPSLNHGDLDDLGLIYYGKGWQLTYEIGYGLGSTHTHVGWGTPTVSHSLVTVNEHSQHGGSGGSAYLFADLPAVRFMAADSPLSYANEGVSQYHRTIALVGQGQDQYLVDIFRVRGGRQHDYGTGVQSQDVSSVGIQLGPEEDGSLAGTEYAWGEKIGVDGDIIGFPNKPYWNPPPKNGYGFFYDMRRAVTASVFQTDFALGGSDQCTFRIHSLPESESEFILAKAPGLYPSKRKATYLIERRKSEDTGNFQSAFLSVMEPYALPAPSGNALDMRELADRVASHRGEIKPIPNLGVLLLKGNEAGDFVTFSVNVDADDEYHIRTEVLQAPSYGTVQVLLDGTPIGQPFCATTGAIQGPTPIPLPPVHLAKGKHELTFRMQQSEAFYIGIASLRIQTAAENLPTEPITPQPILNEVERIAVTGGNDVFPGVGVHVIRRDGSHEYTLSADFADTPSKAETVAGTLAWRGALIHLVCSPDGKPVTLAAHGAWDISLNGQTCGPKRGIWQGTITHVDEASRQVTVDVELPTKPEGACVYFHNNRYSRNTAYRIYGITTGTGTSVIDLGPQSPLIGQGRIHQITADGAILSDIPHDYGRSVVGGTNPHYFDGKRITNTHDASTHLKEAVFGAPMRLEVDSTDRFEEGETFYYHDIQVGDTFIIPTAWQRNL